MPSKLCDLLKNPGDTAIRRQFLDPYPCVSIAVMDVDGMATWINIAGSEVETGKQSLSQFTGDNWETFRVKDLPPNPEKEPVEEKKESPSFETGRPLRLEELKQIVEAIEGLDNKDLQFSGLVTVFSDIDNEFLGQLQSIYGLKTWMFHPSTPPLN